MMDQIRVGLLYKDLFTLLLKTSNIIMFVCFHTKMCFSCLQFGCLRLFSVLFVICCLPFIFQVRHFLYGPPFFGPAFSTPPTDGPLAHTTAAALVVGQCCVIALQLLPVPVSLWMRLRLRHTARRMAQLRLGQQMVSCTTIAQIRGVLQKLFSNTVFTPVNYHFLT